jgi:hypothetical protein
MTRTVRGTLRPLDALLSTQVARVCRRPHPRLLPHRRPHPRRRGVVGMCRECTPRARGLLTYLGLRSKMDKKTQVRTLTFDHFPFFYKNKKNCCISTQAQILESPIHTQLIIKYTWSLTFQNPPPPPLVFPLLYQGFCPPAIYGNVHIFYTPSGQFHKISSSSFRPLPFPPHLHLPPPQTLSLVLLISTSNTLAPYPLYHHHSKLQTHSLFSLFLFSLLSQYLFIIPLFIFYCKSRGAPSSSSSSAPR